MIQNDYISFKRSFTKEYTDKIPLDTLFEILTKWREYLLTVDKKEIEFEV